MNKQQKFILKRGAVLAALLSGLFANAQAGDYSNVYFFGDSLSDNGVYAGVLVPPLLPSNARFTTNPGTVWTDNLAVNYGKSVTPGYTTWQTGGPSGPGGFTPTSTGNNFAVGAPV